MATILLVPFGSPGHLVPFGTLASTLVAHGHEVHVFAEVGVALPPGVDTVTPKRWRLSGQVPPEVLTGGDPAALFRFLFFGSVPEMTEDVRDALVDLDADLVIGDLFMPGAGLAAELTGTPWLSLCCSPIPGAQAYRAFLDPSAVDNFDATSVRAELGLPAAPGENLLGRLSPLGHLVLGTPRFCGTEDLPAQARLIGPMVGPGRPRTPPSTRVVVTTTTNSEASLGGRKFAQDRYLGTAAEVLGTLPNRAVITLPDGVTAPAARSTVEFLGPTPHDELFDDAGVVLCHAGWGTVSRALVRGLPLVLVPLIGDQFTIAERCVELGAAVRLDSATLRAEDLRAAIDAVCDDPAYRAAAAELAEDIRATDPLAAAAAEVSSALRRARPDREGAP